MLYGFMLQETIVVKAHGTVNHLQVNIKTIVSINLSKANVTKYIKRLYIFSLI